MSSLYAVHITKKSLIIYHELIAISQPMLRKIHLPGVVINRECCAAFLLPDKEICDSIHGYRLKTLILELELHTLEIPF